MHVCPASTGACCLYLKRYSPLNRYKYRLVVDESLALGVLGRTGRGACEHFGLTGDDVEIVSASMGESEGDLG